MYPVENKPASHNGWFTPAESNAYYATRYAREGVTVHWWGDGTGASNHDNIVNYMMSQAEQGIKSVNFVVSDAKITQLVDPANVAWCSEGGNPTTVSIEFQPTLGPEGYKKGGWLINELENHFGRTMSLYPHSHWFQTSCPGSIDINRLRAEANKWKSGGYAAGGEEVIPDQDNYYWRYGQKTAQSIRGRQLSRAEFSKYIAGQTPTRALEILEDDPEAAAAANALTTGQVAVRDNWQGQIEASNKAKGELQTTIDQLNVQVKQALADDQADKTQLQDALKQIEVLTAQLAAANKSSQAPASNVATTPDVSWLTKLLAKVFLRK
jgi:hypothetical protein